MARGAAAISAETQHGGAARPDPIEQVLLEEFIQAQCATLLLRHSPEDFLLVRTLADHHQHAAHEAKHGELRRAHIQLDALESLQPADAELRLVGALTAGPARALVFWKQEDHEAALRAMHSALDAATVLATVYGHHYLTARRIYLAGNVARVHLSAGRPEFAAELCAALLSVADGNAECWPFTGADSLCVPLTGLAGRMIRGQLKELAERVPPTSSDRSQE